MFHRFFLRVFSIVLTFIACNVSAESIRWELNNSPIVIDSNVVLLTGDVLTIEAGTEIQFANNIALIVEGKIEVTGQGQATLTSLPGEKWLGLHVKSKHVFVISNLQISRAKVGLELTSSPDVTVSANLLENNDIGLALDTNDGARSNVNRILSNVIQNNEIGISAVSTGADIQNNLLANNTSYGINLSGRSCGGGTACGWRSVIQNNLISGGEVGVGVFGHHLIMNKNDIYNTTVGIYNRKLNDTSYNVTDTNILGWAAFAFVNGLPNSVDAGDIWLGQAESKQSICDVEDNSQLGNVAFVAANSAFATSHNYPLPTVNQTETIAAHYLCPQAERISSDFSVVSLSSGINTDKAAFLDFNIMVSKKFSDAKFIQVLYWPVNAAQTWLTLTREKGEDSFSKTILLPTFVRSGIYEIRTIIATDNAGREIKVEEDYLKAEGYDYRTFIDNQYADDEAPQLQTLTFSTPYSDQSDQLHIDFSISATDDLSGLDSSFIIELYSPTGKSIQKRGLFVQDGLKQTSAELDFVFPKYSSSGTYNLSTIRLYDLAGNVNFSQQWIANNSHSITIENPNSDSISPILNNLTLSSEFDLIAKRPVINVNVTVSDDRSGVKSTYVRLRKPDGGFIENWMHKDLENSSEGPANTMFTAAFALTSDYVTGDYSVSYLCITDEANNERCYYPAELGNLLLEDRININFVDTDSDGIPDEYDSFPRIPIGNLQDTDGDGAPNECDATCQISGMTADLDDDNDGVADVDDAFPLDASESIDTDGDGIGNNADTDDDGDGVLDADDLYPLDANKWRDVGIRHDVDGDGNADILWRNDVTGQNWLWTMNGRSIIKNAGITNITDLSWKIVGRGDFDGDGKSDILWRNIDSGRNYVWLMNGFAVKQLGELNYITDSNWRVKAVTDLDGDGKDDIFWRHVTRGDTRIYLMDGIKFKTSEISLRVADLNWQIVASGDVNGDDKGDIIWRHKLRGDNNIWLMNGTSIISSYVLNNININWMVAGAGDINGDGTDDIIWRNKVDGRNWAYLMNNGQIQSSQLINSVANSDWSIADVSDLDGDGKDDLFWRQNKSAQTFIFLMNGFTIKSQGYSNAVSNNWQVANIADYELESNSTTQDKDKDGISNNIDTDDDNDGVLDVDDAFPLDVNESIDTDDDGIGNNADTDDDNDGVLDEDDAYPLDASRWQRLSVSHDVDGDGNADILWRNNVTGQNWLWTMNGRSIIKSAGITNITDLTWNIAGRGDFDGDGKSDIIWRNNLTGRNYVWLMNGFAIKQQGELNYISDSNWRIKQVADFDGDGKDDIFWHHSARGDTWIYLMNGIKFKSSQASLKVADTNWEVAASGDVNGDGKGDIIWRHKTRGDNYLWLMNGSTISSSYVLNNINTNWVIAGAGDINGDNTDDIIWRNKIDGRNWAYLMNKGQIKTSQLINSVASPDWSIADISDLNGDGKDDLFWRQNKTGQTFIFLMNGLVISSQGYSNSVTTTWSVLQ
jgi:hypothetical protein